MEQVLEGIADGNIGVIQLRSAILLNKKVDLFNRQGVGIRNADSACRRDDQIGCITKEQIIVSNGVALRATAQSVHQQCLFNSDRGVGDRHTACSVDRSRFRCRWSGGEITEACSEVVTRHDGRQTAGCALQRCIDGYHMGKTRRTSEGDRRCGIQCRCTCRELSLHVSSRADDTIRWAGRVRRKDLNGLGRSHNETGEGRGAIGAIDGSRFSRSGHIYSPHGVSKGEGAGPIVC